MAVPAPKVVGRRIAVFGTYPKTSASSVAAAIDDSWLTIAQAKKLILQLQLAVSIVESPTATRTKQRSSKRAIDGGGMTVISKFLMKR